LRKIVSFANTTIHELGNAQNSPTLLSDVPMRLAEAEASIEERRRASDAASIQRAPTPTCASGKRGRSVTSEWTALPC
jgi:hypothetical protein